MTTVRYEGGVAPLEVILPTRSLIFRRGDEAEVSVAEADVLLDVPGFVKSPETVPADEAADPKES